MVRTAAERFGTIDLLVNNAGITKHIAMDDLESATEDVWDELFGVNVKGMFYCARALAPHIRVNCIVPGAVATRWWAGKEEQMKTLAPNLLLERIAAPEDIASLVCAALEQEAMTGQIVTADSGQTL